MQPDVTNVELNRLKGVSYAISITIPTVFVNEFSYYEVVGKLINHLDHIRATQDDNASNMTELSNFVYENITEQREYLNTFYNTFTSDLNTYFNESKQKWADFLEHELSRYNNYYNDLTSRMNTYTNTLQTNLNNFITSLTNKHTNYQEYLTNRHTTHTNNLQTMVNNYKSYIDTNKDNIEENFLTELEDLMTKYQNLLNSINLSKESVRVIITNKYNEWDDAVKSMITEYNDIQQRVIDNNNILEQIITYLKTYPNELDTVGIPLFTKIKYIGTNVPTDMLVNDLWYNGTELYIYKNNTWEIKEPDTKLYIMPDNHLYYFSGEKITITNDSLSKLYDKSYITDYTMYINEKYYIGFYLGHTEPSVEGDYRCYEIDKNGNVQEFPYYISPIKIGQVYFNCRQSNTVDYTQYFDSIEDIINNTNAHPFTNGMSINGKVYNILTQYDTGCSAEVVQYTGLVNNSNGNDETNVIKETSTGYEIISTNTNKCIYADENYFAFQNGELYDKSMNLINTYTVENSRYKFKYNNNLFYTSIINSGSEGTTLGYSKFSLENIFKNPQMSFSDADTWFTKPIIGSNYFINGNTPVILYNYKMSIRQDLGNHLYNSTYYVLNGNCYILNHERTGFTGVKNILKEINYVPISSPTN